VLDEAELSCSAASPVAVAVKLRAGGLSTLSARVRLVQQSAACDLKYEFAKDGLRVEVASAVVDGGWVCPGLAIGFDF